MASVTSAVISETRTPEGRTPRAIPVQPRRTSGRRRFAPGPRPEDVDQLGRHRGSIEIGERERQVGQGRIGQVVSRRFRLLAASKPAARRVESACSSAARVSRSPALQPGELLVEVSRPLVEDPRVAEQSQPFGRRQGPEDGRRGQAIAGMPDGPVRCVHRLEGCGNPRPAAVLVLRRDQLGDEALNPLGQPLRPRARRHALRGGTRAPRPPPATPRRGRPSCWSAGAGTAPPCSTGERRGAASRPGRGPARPACAGRSARA